VPRFPDWILHENGGRYEIFEKDGCCFFAFDLSSFLRRKERGIRYQCPFYISPSERTFGGHLFIAAEKSG
jgi:hypothetical protein